MKKKIKKIIIKFGYDKDYKINEYIKRTKTHMFLPH